MDNQRQPSGSYFGPKSRMSTRSKATKGSMRHRPRFKSKRMNNIVKDMERRKAYMLPNMGKMNFRSGVGVKDNADTRSGKKPCGNDRKDHDGVVFSPEAKKLPQKENRAGQSSDVFPLKKNGASKLKQSLSHISKNAMQSPTLRLDNDLIPLINIKSSKPSSVQNVPPSIPLKEFENLPPFRSKDGSNANLGLRKESLHGTYHLVDLELTTKSAYRARNVDLELMANSAHRARNVERSNNDDDTLGSKSNDRSNRAQGRESNVRKDTKETSRGSSISKELENLTSFRSKDGSNANLGLRKESLYGTSHLVDLELTTKSAHRARNVELELMAKSAHRAKNVDRSNNDDDTLGSKANDRSNRAQGQESNVRKDTKEISRGSNIPFANETLEASCKDKNCGIVSSKDVAQSEFTRTCLHKKDQPSEYVVKSNDVNSKRNKGEGKLTTPANDDYTRVVQQDSLTYGMVKRRRCMPSNEDGDEVGGCNKNLTGVESTIRLTPQEALLKKQQCNYCSKPICEPAWKGIFKIDGKEYISLAGHLSTKSCEKVWELSKSLPPVVEVEYVSRLVTWPSVWKASKPSSDNIGLYFLPENMRHDGKLDQLINEVMENDFLLRAVINDEAEMLIFPSVLLPKRYQTFQAEYYLWAVFNPREDKGAGLAEPPNGTRHLAQATCFKPAN